MKTLNLIFKLTIASLILISIFSFNKKDEIKDIDKNFTKITKNLLCSKYEVTNEKYSMFLLDIKETELFEKCKYDSTNWTTFYEKSYNKPMEESYHWHPAYNHYPVVNIDYNSANEYCKWLTEQYNSTEKRTYKKVKFRLPTEYEWILATQSMSDAKLPWYGNKAYNKENKYMSNIKYKVNGTKGKTTAYNDRNDKAMFMTIKGEFPANELGIYDIICNVSEMIAEKGKAKGGNWNSYISDCYIDQVQEYTESNPEIGFRVFMEIIEE